LRPTVKLRLPVVPGNSDLIDTLGLEPHPFLHPSFCFKGCPRKLDLRALGRRRARFSDRAQADRQITRKSMIRTWGGVCECVKRPLRDRRGPRWRKGVGDQHPLPGGTRPTRGRGSRSTDSRAAGHQVRGWRMPEGLKYIVGITDQRLSSGTRPY